ncbi:MAG: DUF2162 domain-containing protein [Caldimicrobium sp.]
MELSLLFWIIGTFFSLGIFSIKVGLGLAYGRVNLKGILATLCFYLILFIFIAYLAEKIFFLLYPLLEKGPYLHMIMALGMTLWGVFLLIKSDQRHRLSPLPLLIPCPVCLTAMAFSVLSLREVLRVSPFIVGLFLGASFVSIATMLILYSKFRQGSFPKLNLSFAMIILGFYYLLALHVPQKIEEAKAVYSTFLQKEGFYIESQSLPIILLLIGTAIFGYILKTMEGKK